MASVFEELRRRWRVGAGGGGSGAGHARRTGAKKLVDLFTRAERLSVAGRGLAARRVQTALAWKRDGHRSAAHWLASSTGVSVGGGARSLQMARELEALPDTAEAFRAGELSEAQAGEIAAAATLDPSAEARLLDSRAQLLVSRSARSCREASVRAEHDGRCAARRLHEGRAAYAWTDRDGSYRLNVPLAPDEGARLDSALQTATDEIFPAARRAGHREPRAAYMADAIMALLAHGPAKPIEVRLDADHAAILRGYVEPGERCEIAGIGPIPVTIARALLNDARITVLGRQGSDISTISSPDRTIPATLRRWLEPTYPVCGAEGCDCSERLEIDHIIPVEDHGPTDEINCWRICPHHHKLKTYYGWKVEGPLGARRLVPPDEPRPAMNAHST